MKRAGTHRAGPRCATRIAATKDFTGVTGKITLDEKRNAMKPAVVLKVRTGSSSTWRPSRP